MIENRCKNIYILQIYINKLISWVLIWTRPARDSNRKKTVYFSIFTWGTQGTAEEVYWNRKDATTELTISAHFDAANRLLSTSFHTATRCYPDITLEPSSRSQKARSEMIRVNQPDRYVDMAVESNTSRCLHIDLLRRKRGYIKASPKCVIFVEWEVISSY